MKTLKCATCANCGDELNSVVGVNCAECVEWFEIMDAKKLERESKLNNGKAMKTKLTINDLSFYSCALAISESNLSSVADKGELYAEFGDSSFSTEAIEYMLSQEEKQANKDVLKAKVLLKKNKVEFDENMSDEIIMLLAEQYLDSVTNVEGNAWNKSQGVLVIVQQLSNSGRWFTVKNGEQKATYWYDVDTLFEKANGSISGFKMKHGKHVTINAQEQEVVTEVQMPVVIADMIEMGYVVDGWSGRVLLKSTDFRRGAKIEGHVLEEVPAAFGLTVINGEVVKEETNYAWDAITDIYPGISILPSESDTTQAYADQIAHDDNILIGMSVVTPAMSSYYMDSAERDAQIALEKELEIIAIKTSIPAAIKAERHNELMKTDAASVARRIIKLSYINGAEAMSVFNENAHMGEEILKAMKSIKYAFVQGETAEAKKTKGCSYRVYKEIEGLVLAPAKKAAIDAIEIHIIQNIQMLNNSEIDIADLTDEEAIEILDAAIANFKLIPATKITNTQAYSALSERVKAIKYGNQVAEAKALFPKVVA